MRHFTTLFIVFAGVASALTHAVDSSSEVSVDIYKRALGQGFTVNIDAQSKLQEESGWGALEDFLTKATAKSETKGKIILCEYRARRYPLPVSTTCI